MFEVRNRLHADTERVGSNHRAHWGCSDDAGVPLATVWAMASTLVLALSSSSSDGHR